MIDARRNPGARAAARLLAPVQPVCPNKLARWAELVALTKRLGRAIDDAADDGIIEGHWLNTLGKGLNEVLNDLVRAAPEE